MKRRFDHMLLGFVAGMLSPFITFYIYFLYNYRFMGFWRFMSYMDDGNVIGPRLSLCVIANLAVFFLFIYTDKMKSARGVLLSTIIWGAIIAYIKYIR